MEEKHCENCAHYCPYFVKTERGFVSAHYGRCVKCFITSVTNKNFPFLTARECWEPIAAKPAERKREMENHFKQIGQLLRELKLLAFAKE